MIGIIEEQHPDRARLFMQWKQMDWPIMVDSLNLLGVSAVPLTFLIDAEGVIRKVQPTPEDLREFMQSEETQKQADFSRIPPVAGIPARPVEGASAESWRSYGDQVFLWGNPSDVSEAIEAYQHALALDPEDAAANFRLGVAFRRRYESKGRESQDFARAVDFWGRALNLDPNQYIWRRRIQQYGPRLRKPYPFYDWVEVARKEVLERGDQPVKLSAEPSGAELAAPVRQFAATEKRLIEPDPQGRIIRDKRGFVRVETVAVPSMVLPGETVRYHVSFHPDGNLDAHWNNEVEDLVFWVDLPEGWSADQNRLTVPRPREVTSEEVRKLEFEIQTPESFRGFTNIRAYALYYVCEGVNGTCLFRRQDVNLPVRTEQPQSQ